MRAETLVLGGASPEHHEAGPDPQVRPASRGESWQQATASAYAWVGQSDGTRTSSTTWITPFVAAMLAATIVES